MEPCTNDGRKARERRNVNFSWMDLYVFVSIPVDAVIKFPRPPTRVNEGEPKRTAAKFTRERAHQGGQALRVGKGRGHHSRRKLRRAAKEP